MEQIRPILTGEEGRCWNLPPGFGCSKGNGYWAICVSGERWLAHRLSYTLLVGPIPLGLVIDHQCHNLDPECLGGDNCPRVSTERAARTLYERLWNTDPREHGVSLHSYNRARRHAATHGWAPPAAWDDDRLDDPAAHPDWTGSCGTPSGAAAHRRDGLLPVCRPCLDAAAAHQRARRAA